MAGRSYGMRPKEVERVETPYRRIVTKLPVPESLRILKEMAKYEPRSMGGQPLVLWDKAEGFQVYDKYGNMWLDWSSGVLVASAGHSRKKIKESIIGQVKHGLLYNYCFPSELRTNLAKKLVEIAPQYLDKAFILTTGSETVENALKLARTHGQRVGGKKKIGIISFEGAFHGRTLGAQMVGGISSLKEWIVNLDPNIYQVPFPGDFRCHDKSFSKFEEVLREKVVTPNQIAGVITEAYQGGSASFFPLKYIQRLDRWCKQNKVLLIFDEVQAGFGRTGKMFGFEHYNVIPDLVCCGKGISSSLPISAVIGRSEIMNLYEPGTMTSTHGGNPICVAAALASIELIQEEKLVEKAAQMGELLYGELKQIREEHSDIIGALQGNGLVYGLHIMKKGSMDPDGNLAFEIVGRAVEKGLMLFAPVGSGGATLKICPPLTITEGAIKDGASALTEAIEETREHTNDREGYLYRDEPMGRGLEA